ncbi:hypothetical protein TMatcc_000367 [Talaromyces marneffei ATCC 18224]
MAITYALNTPLTRDPCIAVTVLGAISTITTVLRFYALRLRGIKPGVPEWLIVAGLSPLQEEQVEKLQKSIHRQ